jgi:phosphomannomutase
MISFELDDGTAITIRASGTEPKLKYYVEAFGPEPEGVKQRLEEVVGSVLMKDVLRAVL